MNEHTQTFTSATSVTVTHSFGYKPISRVLDSDGYELFVRPQHTSNNAFTYTFAEAVTGTVYYYERAANISSSNLTTLIRTACNDSGVEVDGSVDSTTYIFSTTQINNSLSLVLLDIDDYSADNDGNITPDFANNQDKQLVVYATALLLLAGEVNTMYSTRDNRFQKTAPENQLVYVAQKLIKMQNRTKLPMIKDGSTQAVINAGVRYSDYITGIYEG